MTKSPSDVHAQVDLQRGTTVLKGIWIPERGAHVGALVEVDGEDGLWAVLAVGHKQAKARIKSNRGFANNI